ncbi:MAG: Multi-sensor signal transduction histidine kinase [Berkelbacteria bacterium GW2011_GWA1_36_9]|uniref:histidine kinase n=1 Tax=Berkelbacteria bacterium GW2011_GWA1_36_9 TaxID=1618331 RepID=A0A0G0FXQ5_9BACT|nr:MAG: Multi-sensor signal transduction histidine kinase [Berkelbacteria bacterium GW2011_GWA1_36_9]
MDSIKLYFDTVSLFGFCAAIFVGLIIYTRQKRVFSNKIWFLASASAGLWGLFYFLTINATSRDAAVILIKIVHTLGLFVVFFWFYFLLIFLEIDKQRKIKILFSFVSALGVGVLALNFSPWFMKDMVPKYVFNYYIEPGIGYYIYTVYFFALIICGLYLGFASLKRFPGLKATQIKYILIASGIGFLGGANSFILSYNISLPPYLLVLFPIFPLAIVYAMAKTHLFDVKIITAELLTVTMWLFLVAKLFTSTEYQDFIINFGILLSVVVVGVLLIRSVTREVEQREKIEKMAKELEKAYDVEKKANEELQQIDKIKDQFLMITQHDLRKPLTLVKWFLDTLFLGLLGKQTKKTLEEAKRVQIAIESSIEEVNNFLDITQFQMGKGGLTLKPDVELLPVLDGIVKKLEPQAEQKGIYLKLERPHESFAIEADVVKLKAAITNIVDNAIKYTEKGGVEIKIFDSQSSILDEAQIPDFKNSKSIFISVKDTGIGIPPEKIKNLFDNMFQRTEQAQRTTAIGKGIGLYLSSQIIKAHNGKVWAESEGEGKGSTFHIELPISHG